MSLRLERLNTRIELEALRAPDGLGLAGVLEERGQLYCLLGRFHEADDDFARAVRIYSTLGERGPTDEYAGQGARVLLLRGNAYLEQRQPGQAEVYFRKAMVLIDRAVFWLERRHTDEPSHETSTALVAALDNRGVTRRAQARSAEACRDYDRAVDIYGKLVERDGRADLAAEFAACLINRSYALHEQYKDAGVQKLHEAIRDLERAMTLHANHALDPEMLDRLRSLRKELVNLVR